jgi:EAL domain-containing protein (putative c-di-GMP-specific phosphodiesterase class I)
MRKAVAPRISKQSSSVTTVGGQAQVRYHEFERDRLDSLMSYGVLDTRALPSYDAITDLAARLCETPFACVSFVDADRQWFKSLHGLDVTETPRSVSFCSDVVAAGGVMMISDASTSARYASNPQVLGEPHIRAYLGVPLVGRDGLPLGALAAVDQQPRTFTARQVHEMTILAAHVVSLLEQDRRDHGDGLLAGCVLNEARDPGRMRKALEDGELTPFFQPIVDIRTGRPHQLEALLRWVHPEHGTLSPASFLPAIESTALVVPVGRAVLDAALAQLGLLRRCGIELPGGVAVNVASSQLTRPGLVRDVVEALKRHHLPGSQLTLEITEATALIEPEVALRELRALREAGVHISIDDFGVGWSNLTRVRQLPVDGLKIDRDLVHAILVDPTATVMVASTVSLAQTLGLDVVAEGIETTEVRDRLVDLGCRLGQGWLYSAAVASSDLGEVLTQLSNAADASTAPSRTKEVGPAVRHAPVATRDESSPEIPAPQERLPSYQARVNRLDAAALGYSPGNIKIGAEADRLRACSTSAPDPTSPRSAAAS